MDAIDLFAGAGGLSLGLEAAGIAPVAAVEWCPDASTTYRIHHPEARVVQGDISRLDFRPERGRFAVVAGGPPCQPFSVGGKRLAAGDPRNGIPQFLRALAELQPRAFIMENVAGLTVSTKWPYFQSILAQLEQLGYQTSWQVVEAADYGVPQTRRRLFVVGAREDRFAFPGPTHGPGARYSHVLAGSVVDPHRSWGQPNSAIVTYARRPSLRPGAYHGHLYNGGGRPIELSRLAPTLLASMGGNKTPWLDTLGIVPEYHAHLLSGGSPRQGVVPGARRITVEEAALLQGFPAGAQFAGRRSSQYRQVGNAVPPALGKEIGLALRRQLFD
jgi:DNA (cytosine-5)-methyltransferase 1